MAVHPGRGRPLADSSAAQAGVGRGVARRRWSSRGPVSVAVASAPAPDHGAGPRPAAVQTPAAAAPAPASRPRSRPEQAAGGRRPCATTWTTRARRCAAAVGSHRQRQDRGLPAPPRARAATRRGSHPPGARDRAHRRRRSPRVRARFGGRVGVFHSGLSRRASGCGSTGGSPRARPPSSWEPGRRSSRRSTDLRLIIIDEAHDTSYKQEEEPRYHACDGGGAGGCSRRGPAGRGQRHAPRWRAWPSAGARAAACAARRRRTPPRGRGGRHAAPGCAGCCWRPGPGASSREALRAAASRPSSCSTVGATPATSTATPAATCSCAPTASCRSPTTSAARRLLCHHCGRAYAQPARLSLVRRGAAHAGVSGHRAARPRSCGRWCPREQVFRMDSDVVTSGRGCRRRAGGVRRRAARACWWARRWWPKGHDFPDVTLVMVADADAGLYVPDFRAAERTFQLLTQVAGRAGRAERPGRVLVQTWNPDVPCIRMALGRDERAFYREELAHQGAPGLPAVRGADPVW